MELDIKIGMSKETEVVVTQEMTASHMGSGSAQVLSTPYMITLMEMASYQAVQEALPQNFTTVGTRVCIDHLAATPVGGTVITKATLKEIDRKKLVFDVESYYGEKLIGKGTHDRFIIDTTKFGK
jgi:predicted thioesterase